METYTLQRFYYEAKAIIEKHYATDDSFCLEVQFSIEETDLLRNNVAPRLRCSIYYRDIKRMGSSSKKEFWISEQSPAHTLSRFEEELAESKGNLLRDRVSTEVPGKTDE